jgi:ATP-dependent DNA helicase RecQ
LAQWWPDSCHLPIAVTDEGPDNLVKAGVASAATLNGMLSMPERQDVLEKIRLGDVSILLVSPEQFRNQAFTSAIAQRSRELGV